MGRVGDNRGPMSKSVFPHLLLAALLAGCEVWVLDRPNPLGGVEVEGNLLDLDFASFVGAFRMPQRHGLTMAEILLLEGRRRGWDNGALTVFEVEGWRRRRAWREVGWPWTAPSPNMPTPETAHLYPGLCLFEATAVSEGRGTTRPFQLLGVPGADAPALAGRCAERLAAAGLAGVSVVPAMFRPQFQKHAGSVCTGVELRLEDAGLLRPVRLGFELLLAFRDVLGTDFGWRSEPYEFVADTPAAVAPEEAAAKVSPVSVATMLPVTEPSLLSASVRVPV